MNNLAKKIEKVKQNLPDDYLQVVSQFNVTSSVNEIAQQQGLSEKEANKIDREVMYLLLDIQGPPEFLKNIEKTIDLSHDQSLNIIKGVNKKILRPIGETVESSNEDIPIPPPPDPQKEPPTPDYGGKSDPYREPTD